jgi:hypothetical protein
MDHDGKRSSLGGAMKTELIVALIAGAVALVSAAGTIWSSQRTNFNALAIKRLEIDNEASKAAAQRQNEMSRFSEPLARSATTCRAAFTTFLGNI